MIERRRRSRRPHRFPTVGHNLLSKVFFAPNAEGVGRNSQKTLGVGRISEGSSAFALLAAGDNEHLGGEVHLVVGEEVAYGVLNFRRHLLCFVWRKRREFLAQGS